jgi:Arc/MetJ-type ribon-helix-helix transcriptional regulator
MPEPTGTPAPQTPKEQTPAGEIPASFEEFLEGQDETVKGLYNSHSEALMNTVRATREERDNFKAQIKELSKTQEEGSAAKIALDEMSARLELSERRSDFLEEAMKPEVQCKNTRAAWLLAQADNLFDRKGRPDWAAIKAAAPELFGKVVAQANAGQGTDTPPPASKSMNDWIRSGRQ